MSVEAASAAELPSFPTAGQADKSSEKLDDFTSFFHHKRNGMDNNRKNDLNSVIITADNYLTIKLTLKHSGWYSGTESHFSNEGNGDNLCSEK
ncbi:hypothetical protein [Alkalicoccus urumqiensis]|uniref:hypothetical protein n=1 Tax=Alkalicoccus urumqiensis TaxID=1548213 RepID=UPI001158E227|nr:hypothetical protein [Alkalicoccus urumqiensis]